MSRTADPVALNQWYAVGFAADIAPGAARHTRLLGQAIAIVRDFAGGLAVFEERDGDQAVGRRPVPGLQERYGFLWVTLGDPVSEPPAIPEFTESGRRFLHRGRIAVPASGLRVIENFFDLSHFSFVHTGTLGGYDSAEVAKYQVEFRAQGTELWAVGCSFFQPKASAAAGAGATVYYDYRIPSPYVCILYKDSQVRPGAKDLIGLFVQPSEEDSCIVHSFALLFDESNSDTHILHFYHEIFAQDRAVLIHQQPRRLPLDLRAELPVASDMSSVAYRRWLAGLGLTFGAEPAG